MNCKSSCVSVIVPVYNAEKYLNRCLESLAGQTHDNIEIILVNDGSTDKSIEICNEWAKKDSRISVFNTENRGAAAARNFALKHAHGEFIAFADSDDYAEKEMLETLVGDITENNADAAICGFQYNDENCNFDFSPAEKADSFFVLSSVLTGDLVFGALWNKLYRKSVVSGIEMPALHCCEDLVFNYCAFKRAKRIVMRQDKLYHYMQNGEQTLFNSFSKASLDAVRSKEILLEAERSTPLEKFAVRGLITSCFVALNRIVSNQKCLGEYEKIRQKILSRKLFILKSDMFTHKEKVKVLLLAASPAVYNRFIAKKAGVGGMKVEK